MYGYTPTPTTTELPHRQHEFLRGGVRALPARHGKNIRSNLHREHRPRDMTALQVESCLHPQKLGLVAPSVRDVGQFKVERLAGKCELESHAFARLAPGRQDHAGIAFGRRDPQRGHPRINAEHLGKAKVDGCSDLLRSDESRGKHPEAGRDGRVEPRLVPAIVGRLPVLVHGGVTVEQPLEASLTESVEDFALFGIVEHVVGVCYRHEHLFGGLVPAVAVGVPFLCQHSISPGDRLAVRVGGQAENGVRIAAAAAAHPRRRTAVPSHSQQQRHDERARERKHRAADEP
jgi:hypothetical protein